MVLAYLLLATGLTLSAVAIYYSVVGLTAIFSAAVIPIIVMGGALEIAKLVCASWLKANWERIPRLMKIYMSTAVVILMIITSMGIFGFLSKAHNDQNLVSGDVQSKIAVYDEKIRTAKDNIDANRKALKQMDEAVDQVMGRSSDEKGADKAVAIRRGQQKERSRLQAEIQAEQKTISQLSEERAPIAAEVRKVEAEVGPIKYIAKFIYGESGADENMLEKAVTWIILIIVTVFDPLAVIMLLGAQMTFGWAKEQEEEGDSPVRPEPVIDDSEVTVAEPIPEEESGNEGRQEIPIPSFLLKKDPVHLADVDHEDADNDIVIVKTEELEPKPLEGEEALEVLKDAGIVTEDNELAPEYNEEPKPPKKFIEIMNNEYVLIDGDKFFYNSFGGNDPEVHDAKSLMDKLLRTGEYYTNTIDERPGDYLPEPAYVQNEEQQSGGLWQKIQHPISEEEYIKKSEENKKGNA